MATPDKISTLTLIKIPLGRREFADRQFYAMPSFVRFLRETLPVANVGVLGARETPKAQMDTLLRKWIAGKPMAQNRAFSNLRPTTQAVWEMKTVDLRVFGWIYRPKVFIAAFVGLADDYKSQRGQPPKESYDDARDRVVWIRNQLNLDPPSHTTGAYNDLV